VRQRAESDARSRGYYLNPDESFLKDLLEGLKKNEERYGYPSCPCRLASGNFDFDKDIICPCDYRDPDVEEFGTCYCGLYLRKDAFEGKTPVVSILERRPEMKQTRAYGTSAEPSSHELIATPKATEEPSMTGLKLWYCKQCGYVVFREEPPYVCPICKAKKEFFAEIRIGAYTPS
jgi:ferredoxin-thioredoxin reductase catalytic subunit/rubredoxin